jgi:hypothetical protein
MLDVLEAVRRVGDAVEKIKNDAPQDFPVAANIGDAVRQGDIYIQFIEPVTEAPVFYKKVTTPVFPYQLAPGNTKGSRHCLEHSDGIEIYSPITADLMSDDGEDIDREMSQELRTKILDYSAEIHRAKGEGDVSNLPYMINDEITNALSLSGPIFVVKNPTTVSHPEHGNWNLPAGTYRCVFQRTVTTENVIHRVLD